MYFLVIFLLMFVVPAAFILTEALTATGPVDIWFLIGKWVVFWAIGVRLFLAGLIQAFRPEYTTRRIFGTDEAPALGPMREVGFSNLAIGLVAMLSLARPEWTVPAGIAGGLYLGFAGIGHLLRPGRSAHEQAALASDFVIFAVLAVFVALRGF